ncbi:hypothetical protein M8C21_031284 [Ambrosia artemisiifolia]|uniref:Uncharacterized protein n=1 Tax=Ambrosia artemisiifolia TaxID=4212 RepID=A0AAD5G5T2_AMBAR|nr:hypothetical protein M8C21_031284 [Ambrosia artemisiifolia]
MENSKASSKYGLPPLHLSVTVTSFQIISPMASRGYSLFSLSSSSSSSFHCNSPAFISAVPPSSTSSGLVTSNSYSSPSTVVR